MKPSALGGQLAQDASRGAQKRKLSAGLKAETGSICKRIVGSVRSKIAQNGEEDYFPPTSTMTRILRGPPRLFMEGTPTLVRVNVSGP